ncbi:MAG: DUF554 domain-containing protein [Lachnospiraceae bacterium]|nr:DUF554 domain-containing protein [Lachnospiraceae bacterium]
MIGIGTIVNTAAIAAAGVGGHFFGSRMRERHQETLNMACGVSVLFIGIAGAMKYMLPVSEESLPGGGTLLVVLGLAIGGLIGEIIDIEGLFERFGEWLKIKTGNAKDKSFVNGFVTASLTVCIGAMAIVGSIQDGISGDWSILAAKALLDFIIILVMTCTLGKGCAFSAIPVFLLEGSITVLASFLKPYMTDLAMAYLSMVGSILIFCVGMNLVWGKKVRVANMLPALIITVIAAYLPVSF